MVLQTVRVCLPSQSRASKAVPRRTLSSEQRLTMQGTMQVQVPQGMGPGSRLPG